MTPQKIFNTLFILVCLTGMSAIQVAGYVEEDILKNNQNTPASASHPVKITLKGRDFNVTRQQKLIYENANTFSVTVTIVGILVCLLGDIGKTDHKILPPIPAPERKKPFKADDP